jgi:hypothetical protein
MESQVGAKRLVFFDRLGVDHSLGDSALATGTLLPPLGMIVCRALMGLENISRVYDGY